MVGRHACDFPLSSSESQIQSLVSWYYDSNTAPLSSLKFISGCKEVNKDILGFEAAKIYCLRRRGETHGNVVLSPWRLGREQCTPKDSREIFGESVYIDLLVWALVGCEVKSM